MAIINATSFLLVEDQTVIGHSTSTSISLNLDLIEITTKDSGGWQEHLPSIRGGSISATGLTNYSDNLNFEHFTSYVITKAVKTFYFRDPEDADGTIYRGEAFVSSVDETSEAENVTEFNLELTYLSFGRILQQIGKMCKLFYLYIYKKFNLKKI